MSENITSFLAIWGAGLGTIGTIVSVILAIKEIKKDQKKILVSFDVIDSPSILFDGYEKKNQEYQLVIQLLNQNLRPIQIVNVGILLNGIFISERCKANPSDLPKKLNESDFIKIRFHISELKKHLKNQKKPNLLVVIHEANGKETKKKIPEAIIEEYFI